MITSNQSQSTHQRRAAQALSAANAGLDLAANAVGGAGTQTSLSGSSTVDSNAVTWSAAKTTPASGTPYWTLNAAAISPDGQVKRVVQEQMELISSSGVARNPADLRLRVRHGRRSEPDPVHD